MSQMSRVTAALCATLMTGAAAVASVPSASASSAGAVVAAKRAMQPASFTISSFNVLGASHTPPGGKRASGAKRIVWANRLLERHHVDVAGFQEMQASQLSKFLDITNGGWAVYPGFRFKKLDTENSIGWRTDKFDLVWGTTVKIPYFNGSPRRMPLVLLRDKATGMMAYVANYHNPAETAKFRNQDKWRAEATRVQIALQNQIWRSGIPRFITGDMNERASYFCRMAKEAPLKAARPDTYRKDGVCYANKPRAVDWILGSKKATFTDYDEDRSHLVDITTDHPVISTKVTVNPQRLPRGWNSVAPAPVVPEVTY